MITRETETSLTIQSGPGEDFVRKINKKNIAERRKQNSSLMPSGLLNVLEKDDILDLLAFLKYGSEDSAHNHPDESR
ncbi:hypothetical protein MYX65_12860, partial [Acidobacteria bacterium AH-259-L09]|nr:hypothetical protein [Acidobacteria bacterium AH-259-L09]